MNDCTNVRSYLVFYTTYGGKSNIMGEHIAKHISECDDCREYARKYVFNTEGKWAIQTKDIV